MSDSSAAPVHLARPYVVFYSYRRNAYVPDYIQGSIAVSAYTAADAVTQAALLLGACLELTLSRVEPSADTAPGDGGQSCGN